MRPCWTCSSDGRLEVEPLHGRQWKSFEAFSVTGSERGAVFARNFMRAEGMPGPGASWQAACVCTPAAPHLLERVWQATFSVEGGARAGANRDGLMLSRTQPRPGRPPPGHAVRDTEPHHRSLSRGPACRDAHRASWLRAPCWFPDQRAQGTGMGRKPVCAASAQRHAVLAPNLLHAMGKYASDPQAPLQQLIEAYDVHAWVP